MSRLSLHRANKRFHARHLGAQRRNRLHRHQVALAPEPWGAINLPITFSAGAYEAQSSWFTARTGVGSFFGGPLDRWCVCAAPDPRRLVAKRQVQSGGAPYWQIAMDDDTASAMRAAEEQKEAEWSAKYEAELAAGRDPLAALFAGGRG